MPISFTLSTAFRGFLTIIADLLASVNPVEFSRCRFAQIQLIIESICISKKLVRVVTLSMVFLVVAGCTPPVSGGKSSVPEEVPSAVIPELPPVSIPEVVIDPWTEEELYSLALTLAGECYDHKTQDKRRGGEGGLNRVSDGRFGSSIMDVLTAENQFEGYWTQHRPVSENDYEVAEQALRDWYAGGCKALSEYLFFCAGDNLENQFRCEY